MWLAHRVPQPAVDFLDRDYHYKSVPTQIFHDAALKPVRTAGNRTAEPQDAVFIFFFDLQLPPLTPSIFYGFSNHQGSVLHLSTLFPLVICPSVAS